nr:MAG TPA: hypothetical protein [Bacteriophage sp.]
MLWLTKIVQPIQSRNLMKQFISKKEGQISVCPLSYVRHRGKGKRK